MIALLSFVLAALFVGCASSPQATEFPQRFIDQPYTLPEGVDVWGSVGGIYYERDNGFENSFLVPIPIPLYWEHSINKNLTLEIPLLPVGLRWKIQSDENTELGLNLSWGFGYGSTSGFSAYPNAGLFYKKFLSHDQAIIVMPNVGYNYSDKDDNRNYVRTSLLLGFVYQLNNEHALQPRLIVAYSEYSKKARWPIELFYSYRMAQTWQFESTYRYTGLGYEDYLEHRLTFIFKKYF